MPSKRGLRALFNAGDRNSANPIPGVGVAVAATGIVCREYGLEEARHTRFTFTNYALAMTDRTTAGAQGVQKLYDFPVGGVILLGSSLDLTVARVGTGISATAAMVYSLGTATVGTADGALTSTEADILPSTAGTLAGGIGTAQGRNGSVAIAALTPDVYLNAAVVDAGTSANDVLTLNGFVDVWWLRTSIR